MVELVGAFKRRYQAALLAMGVTFVAAYGNTLTDVYAAEAVLPRERIYLSGVNAGAGGSAPVSDWAQHCAELWRELPPAQPAVPYVSLHW